MSSEIFYTLLARGQNLQVAFRMVGRQESHFSGQRAVVVRHDKGIVTRLCDKEEIGLVLFVTHQCIL
jgi:hypothetical protein